MRPEEVYFESYNLAPTKRIPETALIRDDLSILNVLTLDPYHGGESIVHFNGSIYTGVREGKILRIDDRGSTVFIDLCWPECERNLTDHGRPLGMRLSRSGTHLLVLDAYLGLFSISLSNGSTKKIFPLDDSIKPVIFDDFDILPNGTIILSEMSTKYYLSQLFEAVLVGDSSARVLSVDPETGSWFEMMSGMRFANGVQLHADEQSVLVAETLTYRVLRFPLNGDAPSVFADGLPGQPDNIRASPRGGYWVPVSTLTDTWFGKLLKYGTEWPTLRKIFYKLHRLSPIKMRAESNSGMLLRLNDDGEVVEAWVDPKGVVRNVAEVCEHNGELYTGSYFLPYIGHYKL